MADRRVIADQAKIRWALNLTSTASFLAGVARAAWLGSRIVALALCNGSTTLQHDTEVIMDGSIELRTDDSGRKDGESEDVGKHLECGYLG